MAPSDAPRQFATLMEFGAADKYVIGYADGSVRLVDGASYRMLKNQGYESHVMRVERFVVKGIIPAAVPSSQGRSIFIAAHLLLPPAYRIVAGYCDHVKTWMVAPYPQLDGDGDGKAYVE